VGRDDRRLVIGALCGIALCLGAAMLLRQVPWASFGIKWWATSMQLVGTLVTGFGLLYAWVRATGVWSRHWPRIKMWLAWWLFGKPFDQSLYPAGIDATLKGGRPYPWVRLGLDRTKPIKHQLEHIVQYINTELRRALKGIDTEIGRLRDQLEEMRIDSEVAEQQFRAHMQAQIDELAARLDRTQILDLSWAIGGLFITAIGIFLSYWS